MNRNAAARVFRCSAACRWMPRLLGASVLAAAYIASRALDPAGAIDASPAVRAVVAVAGAVLALWLVRAGSEVHLQVAVEAEGIAFRARGRTRVLAWDDIRALNWDGVMATRTRWMPALVLEDRQGMAWRIPALLEDCDDLLSTVLERAGVDGLRSWARARALPVRIARARWIVPAGYAFALAAVVAATYFYLR